MKQLFRSLLIALFLFCACSGIGNAQNTIIQANNRGLYGVCSTSGKWVISPRYDSIILFGGHYICSSGEDYYFFDSEGKSQDFFISHELRSVSFVEQISDDAILAVYQGFKKAILNRDLHVCINNLTGIDPFAKTNLKKYGISWVQENDKYGVFDTDLVILIWNFDEIRIEQDMLRCRTGSYWESFDLSRGASFVKEQLKKRSQQASVQKHVDEGDKLFRQERYWDAAMAYSQAIDKGYQNYLIFYKRASAFYNNEFYKNAIEDYTSALSFEDNAKAYLYRGLAKIMLNDGSAIADLQKGGPEGVALAKEYLPINNDTSKSDYIASGTGFFIDNRGYIATNYHVIDGAKNIDVIIKLADGSSLYNAKVIITDKTNDIAIIKIQYQSNTDIPYTFLNQTEDVGTSVFAMGYPVLSALGEEIKITDGIISSKTGYQGDVTTYQISAPIQHGNSGGPLFDKNGRLVGITNAGVESLQNVGYAIKVSYLINLIDACSESIVLPVNNKLLGKPFTEQIKMISPFIVIIKIS